MDGWFNTIIGGAGTKILQQSFREVDMVGSY